MWNYLKGYKAPNSMILFSPLLDHNGLPNDMQQGSANCPAARICK